MKSNKIESNPSATAAGAEGDVVCDLDSLSERELQSIIGGVGALGDDEGGKYLLEYYEYKAGPGWQLEYVEYN